MTEPMRIRYGGQAARLALVAGIMGVLWSPIAGSIAFGHPVFLVGGFTLFGGVLLLGGLLMLRGATYAMVHDDKVVLHALVGPVKRTFPVARWSDVSHRDGKLFSDGKKIPLHRTQAHADDWRRFARWLEQQRA